MLFSVIIPTRNRPELFSKALDSVLQQSLENREVIVVVDGSDEPFMSQYHELERAYSVKARFFYLPHREKGHGQSYSMNHGASCARGEFLCFLDDDDFWTATNLLEHAAHTISANPKLDLYYTNQKAFFADGTQQQSNVWIEDLTDTLGLDEDSVDAVAVTRTQMLSSGGFPHLNCSIIRRSYYLSLGGMDENIRYECDRDVFMRCVDATDEIYHCPAFVSQHHIPDQNKKDNMSTLVGLYEKSLYQVTVYQKAIMQARTQDLKDYSIRNLSYIYKRIATTADKLGEAQKAYTYAKQALALRFGYKWLVFTLWLFIKRVWRK